MSEIVKDLRARCDNILAEIRININKSKLKDADAIQYTKRINELEKYKNTSVINELKSVFDELQSMSTNLTNFNNPITIETVTDNSCTTSSADCTSLNLELETLKKSITLKEKADAKRASDEKEKASIDAKKKADAIAVAFSEINEKADASIASIDEIDTEISKVDALIGDAITKTNAVSNALSPIATLDANLKALVLYNGASQNGIQLTEAIDIVETAFDEISKIAVNVDPICTAVDFNIPIITNNNKDIKKSLVAITSLNITNKIDDLIALTNDSNGSSSALVTEFNPIKTGIETEIKKFNDANNVTDFHAYCTDFRSLVQKINGDILSIKQTDIETTIPSYDAYMLLLDSILVSPGILVQQYPNSVDLYNKFKQADETFKKYIKDLALYIDELNKAITGILVVVTYGISSTIDDNSTLLSVKSYYKDRYAITEHSAFEPYILKFDKYRELIKTLSSGYLAHYGAFAALYNAAKNDLNTNNSYKTFVSNNFTGLATDHVSYKAIISSITGAFNSLNQNNDDMLTKSRIINLLSSTPSNLYKIIVDKLNLLKVDPFNTKLIESKKKANDANKAAGIFKTDTINGINTEIANITTFNDTNMFNAINVIGTPALKGEIDRIKNYIKSVIDKSAGAMNAVDGASAAPIDELKKVNADITNIEAVVNTASTGIDLVNTTIKQLSDDAKDSADAIKPANAIVITKVAETKEYIEAVKTAAENAYQSQTITGGKSISGYHRSTNSQYNKSDDKSDDKSDYMDYTDDTKQYLGGAAFGILGGCMLSEYWKPIVLVLCILALLYIIYLIQAEKTKKDIRNLYNTYENIDQYGEFYSDTNL
jgi:hypothetical protein